jgi:hypothetical protein
MAIQNNTQTFEKRFIAFTAQQNEKPVLEERRAQTRLYVEGPEKDVTTFSTDSNEPATLPKINPFRAIFSRIPQEVTDEINRTGKMPENMMIGLNPYGQYYIKWANPITHGNVSGGTQTLPQHLELRDDVLGFTHVVPKDYKHWLLDEKEQKS